MGVKRLGFLAALFAALTAVAAEARGQQGTVTTPFQNINDGFFESFGGGFGFSAAQGSSRSTSMTSASLTLTNGAPGFIAATTQRPFVTSFVPVVGGYGGGFAPVLPAYGPAALMPQYTTGPSVIQQRIAQMRQEGYRPAIGATGVKTGDAGSAPKQQHHDAFQARLAEAAEGSAGKPAASIAAIKERAAEEQSVREREIAELRRKIKEAEAAGKPQIARIYEKQLERRTASAPARSEP